MITDSTNIFTSGYYRQTTPDGAESGGFEQTNALGLFPFVFRPMFVSASAGAAAIAARRRRRRMWWVQHGMRRK
jgi:hypothetical protein